jgi:hypothetical protein
MGTEVIGFGIQVRQTGRKSFTLDYTFEGRRRRFFIGDFPDWSTAAAREQAKQIKRSFMCSVRATRGRRPKPLGRSRSARFRLSRSRNCRA